VLQQVPQQERHVRKDLHRQVQGAVTPAVHLEERAVQVEEKLDPSFKARLNSHCQGLSEILVSGAYQLRVVLEQRLHAFKIHQL
jgi:hypothetical protein